MKKAAFLLAVIMSALLFTPLNSLAATHEFFMCMHADSTMAYQSIDGNQLDYIEMKDSNGTVVEPKIIQDSTYLPFRYIAETVGLTGVTGSVSGSNIFKYESTGGGKITIVTKTARVTQTVGKPFTFKMDDGTEVEYTIVNIDGSLYFPLRYMTWLVNGEVDWADGNIYFMSSKKAGQEFLTGPEGHKTIKYSKMTLVSNNEYDNSLGYSDIYLQSDGATVSSVTNDIGDGSTYYSVTRSRKNLYFVDEEYNVLRKKETDSVASTPNFYNDKNERIYPKVSTIISYQNKLYGVEIDPDKSTVIGRIFKCDLDGENYHYIGDEKRAYNILLRDNNGEGYIFYVDADNHTDIHRISLADGNDEVISVTDYSGESIIAPIDIMSVGEDTIIISELNNKKLDIIYLVDSIYESNHLLGMISSELTEINKATAVSDIKSLNYDTDNGLLYFINEDKSNYSICCYDTVTSKNYSIHTSKSKKRRISIIKMSDNLYRVYHYSDVENNGYTYDLVSVSDDGTIKIGANIIVNR